jgi:hypothetical protein
MVGRDFVTILKSIFFCALLIQATASNRASPYLV